MSGMFARARQLLTHCMLAMMLATFLSPTFGWGVVASHHQSVHGVGGAETDTHHAHGHAFEHDHNRTGVPADVHEHPDAHASMGHLLSHLPAGLFEPPRLLVVPAAHAAIAFLTPPLPRTSPEPPLRPPKSDFPD